MVILLNDLLDKKNTHTYTGMVFSYILYMTENWKDIHWYEWYYQVSDMWNVRSLDRIELWHKLGTKYLRKKMWRVLSQKIKSNGYKEVNLSKDWKTKMMHVHRLVWQAFLWLDILDKRKEMWHIDNNKTNNKVSNLCVCTHRENENHKILCGRTTLWEKNGMSKLTSDQVLQIYSGYKCWLSKWDLWKKYLVNNTTIHSIISGKLWKHLYHHF